MYCWKTEQVMLTAVSRIACFNSAVPPCYDGYQSKPLYMTHHGSLRVQGLSPPGTSWCNHAGQSNPSIVFFPPIPHAGDTHSADGIICWDPHPANGLKPKWVICAEKYWAFCPLNPHSQPTLTYCTTAPTASHRHLDQGHGGFELMQYIKICGA